MMYHAETERMLDSVCAEHVRYLEDLGIAPGLAESVVNRARGVARAAVEGLPPHMQDEALVAKLRYELADTERIARRTVDAALDKPAGRDAP